ncbi:hypothetical protein [Flavobacterium sp.]|uniref:hypothetical protein n=1 Tax=Flavobacterium sp. TaxID=239 RepID=UPI00260B93E4|nr:hypothetical protein [Flavobacterium sp.]MDD3004596.1 hypothetical protein [Flavobacterium sp.]
MKKISLDSDSKIKPGFKVPELYFDDLSSVILAEIESKKASQSKVFSIQKLLYAVAAVLILALSIPFFNTYSQPSLEEIDASSLENYIAYQSTISSFDLINSLETKELEKLQIEMNVEDALLEDLLTTNPNLENYIIE